MSKKKLIITITSLCLVLVAAVAAVVGVVAASTQTVNSSITVNYVADNVRASASYAIKYQNDSYTSDTGTVSFTASQASGSQSVTVPELTLGNKGNNETTAWSFARYVIIRFNFHNNYAANAGRKLNVTPSGTVTAFNTAAGANYALAFAANITGTEPTVPTMPTNDGALESDWIDGNTNWKASPANVSLANITQNTSGYVYVLVAMIDPTLNTAFTSTAIQFSLTSAAANA